MIEELLCEMLEAARIDGRPVVLGLCGAQGGGKSTVSRRLVERLQAHGMTAAVLSLDDLYLTRDERQALADQVHPLLRTRGVPGTHDVALGERVLDQLGEPGRVPLPAFDKAADDRRAQADWPVVQAPLDILVFEGWCVGARPQAQAELSEPVNALERDHDPSGAWRAFANAQLAGPYQRLFARIDVLALLAAPDFSVVEDWRGQQEAELRERLRRDGAAAAQSLDAGQVAVFIQHFQRITEHILREMPSRADVVFRLGRAREVLAVERPNAPPG
jgi:D-glycerate 3-kinase